ncbi:acyltransferase domain-containing protein [Marinactinospora rubrisoli]|uniref:Acyltransferase domain-containing protein n=1 Tax=Marinactinospora rubrisoli TaxID=2715399 RepID=A0ABW2KAL4_9ACTN
MDLDVVRERLGLPERLHPWLDRLTAVAVTDTGVPLPGPEGADAALGPFALSERDRAELTAMWPGPGWGPERWWLLERMYALVAADLGATDWREWPSLMDAADARVRCAPVFAFAAATPLLRAAHARDGVPAEVTAATLADVGRHVAKTRVMFGRSGLEVAAWVALHYRGGLYELGRLQYERAVLRTQGAVRWYEPEEAQRFGPELAPGRPVLRLHIPQTGPLTPEAVDASLARARGFFADRFGVDYPVATCTSWLLDPQLAGHLPETANILRFQRRFTLLDGGSDGDSDVFRFVFQRPEVAPDAVVGSSRLERAILGHLRAGGHWRVRTGWLRLPR